MKIMLDTNILLRASEPNHPHHLPAVAALRSLSCAGHLFYIASQSVSEFLAVATRSVTDRGLGMNQVRADAELTKITGSLEMLFETKAVVDELRALVLLHSVSGKSVHDTRLVAFMNVNLISYFLTFNTRDFSRFTALQLLDPLQLVIPSIVS